MFFLNVIADQYFQFTTTKVLGEPELLFHYMDPLIGMTHLLRNPEFRARMKFSPDELTEAERQAGHFLSSTMAADALKLLPTNGHRVLPLFVSWWSDATNVSCGGEKRK
jgi:hypothetical protein